MFGGRGGGEKAATRIHPGAAAPVPALSRTWCVCAARGSSSFAAASGGRPGKAVRLSVASAPSRPAPRRRPRGCSGRGPLRGGSSGGAGRGRPGSLAGAEEGPGAGRCRAGQRGGLGGGRGAARRGFASHFGFSLQSPGAPLRGRGASSCLRGRVREERGKEPARGIPVRIPARLVPPRVWAGPLESTLLPGAPVAQEDALGAGGGRPPAAVRR